MTPEEFIDRLETYFDRDKLNIYSLALHFGMSVQRFENHYLNSKDPELRRLSKMATNAIAAHAMEHEEEYKRSLRYILARENTGKEFIELSEEVKENNAKILILPEKEIKNK